MFCIFWLSYLPKGLEAKGGAGSLSSIFYFTLSELPSSSLRLKPPQAISCMAWGLLPYKKVSLTGAASLVQGKNLISCIDYHKKVAENYVLLLINN